jgi:hypothetical protein
MDSTVYIVPALERKEVRVELHGFALVSRGFPATLSISRKRGKFRCANPKLVCTSGSVIQMASSLRTVQPNRTANPACARFWCLVRGVPEHHPEATYYQRIKRDGKWKWESLGADRSTASCKAVANLPIPSRLNAAIESKPESEKPTTNRDAFRLDAEIKIYLSNVKSSRLKRTRHIARA